MKKQEKIYKKKHSGRYYEIGQEFWGFPVNGIWLVVDGSQNCIVKLEDINRKDISNLKGMDWTYNTIIDVLKVVTEKPYTQAELANTITTALHIQ